MYNLEFENVLPITNIYSIITQSKLKIKRLNTKQSPLIQLKITNSHMKQKILKIISKSSTKTNFLL